MKLPDWRHRAEYIRTRSARKESLNETNIEPEWANEAYADPHAVVIDPDPACKSGRGARAIGWSESAGFVITVLTIIDPGDGVTLWGNNAWRANTSDQRRYTNEDGKE